jgi:hypothetical protein
MKDEGGTMYIARIYDRAGRGLAELYGIRDLKRNTALNKYGTCQFTIPVSHPLYREDLLAQDNRLVVHSTLGIEPQGFLVAGARDWDGSSLQIQCMGAASVWEERRVIPSVQLTGVRAHEAFTAIVNAANQREHTGIVAGEVFQGGDTHDFSGKYDTPYKLLEHLRALTDFDW